MYDHIWNNVYRLLRTLRHQNRLHAYHKHIQQLSIIFDNASSLLLFFLLLLILLFLLVLGSCMWRTLLFYYWLTNIYSHYQCRWFWNLKRSSISFTLSNDVWWGISLKWLAAFYFQYMFARCICEFIVAIHIFVVNVMTTMR